MAVCVVRIATFGIFGSWKVVSEASALHPSDKTHRTALCYGRNRFSRNPSSDGFLCSPEHSKVCIELLDTFWVTLKSLALTGSNRSSVVGRLERITVTIRHQSDVRKISEGAVTPQKTRGIVQIAECNLRVGYSNFAGNGWRSLEKRGWIESAESGGGGVGEKDTTNTCSV